jgi:hypothetical protein
MTFRIICTITKKEVYCDIILQLVVRWVRGRQRPPGCDPHRLGLKITPLDATVPHAAQTLIEQIAVSLPHVKITDLLLEVDNWTGFNKSFTRLKSGEVAKDRIPLLTTVLADAINLGLTKMAESCPGASYEALVAAGLAHTR